MPGMAPPATIAAPGAYAAPAIPGTYATYMTSSKSRKTAGLLGILLGGFGAHNFYLGYTSKGLAQLLLTVITLGLFWIFMEVWGISDAIQILSSRPGSDWHRDAWGYELRD